MEMTQAPADTVRADDGEPALEPSRLSRSCVLLILLTIVGASFSPALFGPFVLDDQLLVLENPLLSSSGPWTLLVEPVRAHLPGGTPNWYYRPLSFASLWIDWKLWGNNPFGFHLTSLLLHLGSTVVLYRLVRRLIGGCAVPLAVAGVWALLPTNIEPSCYISARHDVLFHFLYLVALEVWISGVGPLRVFVFCALSLLAFCAKEMAVTLPVVAMIFEVVVRPGLTSETGGLRWRRLLVCAGVLVMLLGIRWVVLLDAGGVQTALALPGPVLLGSVGWHYLQILAEPLSYSIDRSRDVVPSSHDAIRFAGVVGVVALGLALLVGRAEELKRRVIAFGLLWALVAYAPVSNIVPLYTTCADRYLYLPSAAVLCALVIALTGALSGRRSAVNSRRGVPWIWLVPVVPLAVLATYRSTFFAEEGWLYETSLQSSDSAMLHNNYGLVLRRRNDIVGAEREFERALQVSPEYNQARFNLGVLRRQSGDTSGADTLFAEYLSQEPESIDGWYQWGLAALARDRLPDAVQRLERASALAPENVGIAYHLAVALESVGEHERAREVLARLGDVDRNRPKVASLLGKLDKKWVEGTKESGESPSDAAQ